MKKFIFFFSCSLLAFQPLFARGDFQDGFIITPQHDTIFLKIDYRSTAKNYKSCRTTTDGTTIKEYGPEELLGYGFIDDKCFVSGIVNGSFVEILVFGTVSLYRHGDLFYIKKDEALHQLTEQEVPMQGKYVHGFRKDVRWKGFLAILINDCLASQDVLAKLKFNERPITDLVVQYNTCRQLPFKIYKATKKWTKAELGVVLGMTQSTLVIDNQFNYNIPALKGKYQSLNPTVGLMVALSSPKVSHRVAFQSEFYLSQVNYSSKRVQQTVGVTRYDDMDIDLTTVSVPMSIRYTFPERTYSLQLNVGFNVDFHLKSKTWVTHEVVDDGVVTTTNGEPFGIKKTQFGYVAGFGVLRSFSKFKAGLLVRYVGLPNFSDMIGFVVEQRKLSLSMIIQLK
jgi:hypothetical protein